MQLPPPSHECVNAPSLQQTAEEAAVLELHHAAPSTLSVRGGATKNRPGLSGMKRFIEDAMLFSCANVAFRQSTACQSNSKFTVTTPKHDSVLPTSYPDPNLAS